MPCVYDNYCLPARLRLPQCAASRVAAAAPAFGTLGLELTAMDRDVKPGDDFFDYVNGAWAARTAIPADRTFAGINFVLNDKIERDVRRSSRTWPRIPQSAGAIGQQVGDFYASLDG